MSSSRRLVFVAVLALASFSLGVLAHDGDVHGGHGGDHSGHMEGMNMGSAPLAETSNSTIALEPYYFEYELHKVWLVMHIVTMLFAWVVVMPVATMLSIAGSRYHAPAQIALLAINTTGVGLATVYSGLTPDLYPGNSHKKLGWTLVVVLAVQAAIGVISVVVRRSAKAESWQRGDFTAVAPCCPYSPVDVATRLWLGRHSADSGRGLSMEQNSPYEDEEDGLEREEWNPAQVVNEKADDERPLKRLERFLSARVPAIFNARVVKICDFAYSAISRLLIPLGYTQICLGIITGSGIFMGSTVFNGLAHFIKGSIFIFYGIFTLSRWLGSFADLGWAWNQPSKRFTSEEAVSSMIIFIYGCANVFLEHLAGWGGAWSHGDLQHVSIAFMFFGGGLLGMLFESRRIRSFLSNASSPEETTPGLSFNPMPSIVIFLLGILMSQHHQPSHLSTVIHTQWGMLLAAAAVFRLLTYMMFFRAPPQGLQPSRPPTEVVAAFCLVAGGLVFMISNKDTVAYLDVLGVDAMFSLTVTVGFTALVLSWVTVVVAVKGWAGRKEVRREAGRV